MKQLVCIILLAAALPSHLAATSDEETGSQKEVPEHQSTSLSSEEESESSAPIAQSQVLPQIKSKPAWKRWVGYGFITLFAVGSCSDATNFGYGFDKIKTTIALPYDQALPANSANCEYRFDTRCEDVVNEALCQEYLAQSPEDEVILGECVVAKNDPVQLTTGIVSWVTRLITGYFTYQGIDSAFLKR